MKIAIGVDDGRNFVARGDGSPAIVDAFTCEGEVKAEVSVGMRFRVVGNFRKPWAGDHEAAGIDSAGFEGLNGGGVHGMCNAEVVRVDDEEFCVARKAELFLE